jgi:hypothetical protein
MRMQTFVLIFESNTAEVSITMAAQSKARTILDLSEHWHCGLESLTVHQYAHVCILLSYSNRMMG